MCLFLHLLKYSGSPPVNLLGFQGKSVWEMKPWNRWGSVVILQECLGKWGGKNTVPYPWQVANVKIPNDEEKYPRKKFRREFEENVKEIQKQIWRWVGGGKRRAWSGACKASEGWGQRAEARCKASLKLLQVPGIARVAKAPLRMLVSPRDFTSGPAAC